MHFGLAENLSKSATVIFQSYLLLLLVLLRPDDCRRAICFWSPGARFSKVPK